MKNNSLQILLVQKNITNLASYFSGTRLNQVESLAKAIEYISSNTTDLIIVDLNLPDSKGIKTLTTIREVAPNLPVIVISGNYNAHIALQTVRAGAQDFLVTSQLDPLTLPRIIRFAIERHRVLEISRHISMHDELTGLHNRRGFLTFASHHIKLSAREKKDLVVFYIDIDHMKYINDSFGHQEGDKAIQIAAKILKQSFRDTDIVARLGGDEFVAIAINSSDNNSEVIINRITRNVNRVNQEEHLEYKFSLSIGSASFTGNVKNKIEEMIAKADESLYAHKRSKRFAAGAGHKCTATESLTIDPSTFVTKKYFLPKELAIN